MGALSSTTPTPASCVRSQIWRMRSSIRRLTRSHWSKISRQRDLRSGSHNSRKSLPPLARPAGAVYPKEGAQQTDEVDNIPAADLVKLKHQAVGLAGVGFAPGRDCLALAGAEVGGDDADGGLLGTEVHDFGYPAHGLRLVEVLGLAHASHALGRSITEHRGAVAHAWLQNSAGLGQVEYVAQLGHHLISARNVAVHKRPDGMVRQRRMRRQVGVSQVGPRGQERLEIGAQRLTHVVANLSHHDSAVPLKESEIAVIVAISRCVSRANNRRSIG